LLVTGRDKQSEHALLDFDLPRGRVRTLTDHGPPWWRGRGMESPRRRLRAGWAGAADRPRPRSPGPLYAFKPDGSAIAALMPPFPVGGEHRIESIGFVSRSENASGRGRSSPDRGHQGQPFVGTDSILRLDPPLSCGRPAWRGGDRSSRPRRGEDAEFAASRGAGFVEKSDRRWPIGTHSEGHISFPGVRPTEHSGRETRPGPGSEPRSRGVTPRKIDDERGGRRPPLVIDGWIAVTMQTRSGRGPGTRSSPVS